MSKKGSFSKKCLLKLKVLGEQETFGDHGRLFESEILLGQEWPFEYKVRFEPERAL